jgi:hypothetical protein
VNETNPLGIKQKKPRLEKLQKRVRRSLSLSLSLSLCTHTHMCVCARIHLPFPPSVGGGVCLPPTTDNTHSCGAIIILTNMTVIIASGLGAPEGVQGEV